MNHAPTEDLTKQQRFSNMPKSVFLLLFFVLPFVGMAQSARRTNKRLQRDYIIVVLEFELSLLESDSIEHVYHKKGIVFQNDLMRLHSEQDALNLKKQRLLEGFSVNENGDKLAELLFNEASIQEVTIPDVRSVTDSILKRIDELNNEPKSWPLDTASYIANDEFDQLSLKEKNKALVREIEYLKGKIESINSSCQSKKSVLIQENEMMDIMDAFDNEMSACQQKLDFYAMANLGKIEAEIDTLVESSDFSNQQPIDQSVVYSYADQHAEFPGGIEVLKAYVDTNLNIPEIAIQNGIQGKCYLQFIVSAKGNISNVKVIRGIPNCPECDQEAIRVVKAMPIWVPGKINGKPVNSRFYLPVSFKLP
jgi:TonB family protein